MSMIKKAIITNNTSYDSSRCHNGGHYSFWQNFEYAGEIEGTPVYRRSYHTSADFEYCNMCGSFGCERCENYDLLSAEQVIELINEANGDSSPKIFAEVEVFEDSHQYETWMTQLKRLVATSIESAGINQILSSCAALGIDPWKKLDDFSLKDGKNIYTGEDCECYFYDNSTFEKVFRFAAQQQEISLNLWNEAMRRGCVLENVIDPQKWENNGKKMICVG